MLLTYVPVCGASPARAAAGEDDRSDELSPAQLHPVVPRQQQSAHRVRLHTAADATDAHHSQGKSQSPEHFHLSLTEPAAQEGQAELHLRSDQGFKSCCVAAECSTCEGCFCWLSCVAELWFPSFCSLWKPTHWFTHQPQPLSLPSPSLPPPSLPHVI